MKVAIGSDHAGFEQKEIIKNHLIKDDVEVYDVGTNDDSSVDYPDYAKKVCDVVKENSGCFGVLVCGTGIGMSISANKIVGIRAANVKDVNFAKLARQHNNANVICLSGRFVGLETNLECVDAFISEDFLGDRHQRRIDKITQLERENLGH